MIYVKYNYKIKILQYFSFLQLGEGWILYNGFLHSNNKDPRIITQSLCDLSVIANWKPFIKGFMIQILQSVSLTTRNNFINYD